MKHIKNFICVAFALSILNTFCAKSLHEFFSHDHHHEAQCDAKTLHHFHKHQAPTCDLVCSFTFSVVDGFFVQEFSSRIQSSFKANFSIKNSSLSFSSFIENIELRGPPTVYLQ